VQEIVGEIDEYLGEGEVVDAKYANECIELKIRPQFPLENLRNRARLGRLRVATSRYTPCGMRVCLDEASRLFINAGEEHFEDGMESRFTRGLDLLVARFGSAAFIPLDSLIRNGNTAVAGEALRWVGRVEHEESYKVRLDMLTDNLSHEDAGVRDAASLGIASIDDPVAIPKLKEAIKKEQCEELQRNMSLVLEQLADPIQYYTEWDP